MALTATQQNEILRILGYPALGQALNMNNATGAASMHSFYRIWEAYEWLLTRFNSMLQDEEVYIFGAEHAAFGSYVVPALATLTFSGATPVVGTELQIQVDGSLLTYTVQTSDTPTKIALAVALLISGDPVASQLCVANPEGPACLIYVRTPGATGNGIPVQAMSSDASLQVSLGGTATQVVYGVTSGGTDPPGVKFTPQNATVPVYGYVPIIRLLEADLVGTRTSLIAEKVDVLTYRKSELRERAGLLRYWKRELADRFNVPSEPDFAKNKQRMRGRRTA
jgi:hypothetical protein